MKVKKTPGSDHKKTSKKRFDSFIIIAILVIISAALGFFFWHQNSLQSLADKEKLFDKTLSEEISVPQDRSDNAGSDSGNRVSFDTAKDKNQEKRALDYTVVPPPAAPAINKVGTEEAAPGSRNNMGDATPLNNTNGSLSGDLLPSRNTANVAKKADGESSSGSEASALLSPLCETSASTIKGFYGHLDNQTYMQQYSLPSGSEVYFTQLIQRLLDNPPIVSGETNDLFTILQNTAHFFRIIGKDNILVIKGILDREKNLFENVLSDFYSILQIPGCPESSFSLSFSNSSLYDYAGFFLNTMGGRLYLFRRDSMSRMVVSYYAILLIDHANKNGSNRHGIEIRTSIDQLIDEIESTSNSLLLKDIYLDNLYDLKEEYQ